MTGEPLINFDEECIHQPSQIQVIELNWLDEFCQDKMDGPLIL